MPYPQRNPGHTRINIASAPLQPVADTPSITQTSYLHPPADAHLTCRGVKSDNMGDRAGVPAPLLFYHGTEMEKTSYVTVNELTLNDPDDGKPSVQAALDGAAPCSL